MGARHQAVHSAVIVVVRLMSMWLLPTRVVRFMRCTKFTGLFKAQGRDLGVPSGRQANGLSTPTLESISELDGEVVGLRVIPWPLIKFAQAVFVIEFNDSAPFRIDHVQVGQRQYFVAIPNLEG